MYLSRFYRPTLLSSAVLCLAASLVTPSLAQVNAAKSTSLPLAPSSSIAPAPPRMVSELESISGLKARILKKQALAPKLSKKEQAELAAEMKKERRELLDRTLAATRRLSKAGKAGKATGKSAKVVQVKAEEEEEEENEGPASTQAEAARLYRLMTRLGPGQDSLDQDAIYRAMQQRDAMKPAPGPALTNSTNKVTTQMAQPKGALQPGNRALVTPDPGPTPLPPVVPALPWEFLGPKSIIGTGSGPSTGRVNAIIHDPRNPGTAYCGGAKGGVWKTVNFGTTWTPLTDNQAGLAVSCISLDPFNSNIIYVGTGDYDGGDGPAYGLLKSFDGGATWTTTGAGLPNVAIHKILVDPVTSSTLYAAAGTRGLYKSTNSGANWTRINIRFPDFDDSGNPLLDVNMNRVISTDRGNVSNVTFDSTHQELIVCSSGFNDNVNKGGVYSSFDFGATWNINLGVSNKPLKTIGRTDVATSLSTFFNIFFFGQAGTYDPATMYVIDGGARQIYKRRYALINPTTGQYGYLWTMLTNPATANWGQQTYDLYIATGGLDRVFIGLVGFHFSADGGATWIDGQQGHSDQHAISIINNTQYLIGNDGGAWAGTLTGVGTTTTSTVQSLNPNLFLTQFYFAGYHPGNPFGFLGGSQDNSSPHTSDAAFWPVVPTGDGGGSVINQDMPGTQYTSSYNSRVLNPTGPEIFPVYRTDDTWNTIQDISVNVVDDNLPFLATIKANLADPRLVYLGTNYLWQYNAATNVWRQLPQELTANRFQYVLAIGTSPSNKNVIYTGTTDGFALYSSNGGQTFSNITANLPGSPIKSLFVSPANPQRVYATVEGSGTSHVFRCDDATNPNWIDISGVGAGKLPDIFTHTLAIVPSTNEKSIYVGTDIGVFATVDGGTTWTNATAPLGLPNAEIEDLTVVPATGYLMASSYGRGTWRLKIPIPTATVTFTPTLQGYRGDKTKLRFTISSAAGVFTGNLSPAGTFQFTAPVDTTYNFYIAITGFLHKRISGQYVAGNTIIGGLFYNGDVNGDNVIDATDSTIVSGRLRPPGQRVIGLPDVDGDGIMTSNDLLIVQSNLGRIGD